MPKSRIASSAPWNLSDRVFDASASEDHHGYRVVHAEGRDIAYCLITSDNPYAPSEEDRGVCEANARLIAAAPDLLEAAKDCVDFVGVNWRFTKLSEAIAKAEGRG